MRLNIKLPSQLKSLPYSQREAILAEFQKALDITPLAKSAKNTEHNIWLRNDEALLGDAEEEFYQALIMPSMEAMAELIAALGLSDEKVDTDLHKAFSEEFLAYEDTLIKAKDNGQHKISDLMKLSKQKKQAFLKYIQGAGDWSRKKLQEIDRILTQKLPDYAKLAEQFAVRSAFIAKIRNQADTEALDMVGAAIDRFPMTIQAAKKEKVVVTQRQKQRLKPEVKQATEVQVPPEKPKQSPYVTVTAEELEAARKEWKKIEVLPLQPQEVRTVEQAEMRTAEKLSEVADRHKAAIKQIVLQAINGRWSAQKLAQALFDQFGDMNRDWRRVAMTELSMAQNDAYLSGCADGEQVWVAPVAGACKHCQNLLEGKTFTVTIDPKIMEADTYKKEMRYVWVGKSNFGRKVATWIPCIPLHPLCRHRYTKISRFYKVGEDGKPVLKDVKQLIQEERARRGLPPDPNLK